MDTLDTAALAYPVMMINQPVMPELFAMTLTNVRWKPMTAPRMLIAPILTALLSVLV